MPSGNLLDLKNPQVPHLQRGQRESTCLRRLSWGSDEVPGKYPARYLPHPEVFVKQWILLLVGLSNSICIGGEDIPTPASHSWPPFLWLGNRNTAADAEFERLVASLSPPLSCLSTSSVLKLCWAEAGHECGRPGGQAFPWSILFPLSQIELYLAVLPLAAVR